MNIRIVQWKRATEIVLLILLLNVVGMTKVQAENIIFADANVKHICVSCWDTNNDGELSYEEAAAVTDIGQVFRSKNSITMFNELQYFTSVTNIGQLAFFNCGNLASIHIPNSVTTIDHDAFKYCHSLSSLVFGNSVVSIGQEAFYNCNSLTGTLSFPQSLTSIEWCAFGACDNITAVSIGPFVNSISYGAFTGCSNLGQIVIAPDNTTYDSRNNCNAIIESSSNTLVLGCKNTVIPNTVTSIGSYAFNGCWNLQTIVIPNSVTQIGSGAFQQCTSLTSITIPNSVRSIGMNAFNSCSGLVHISVDSDNTFYDSRDNCNAIIWTRTNALSHGCKNTVIPNSVTSIDSWAFNGRGLTSIISFAEIPPTLSGNYLVDVPFNTPVYVLCDVVEDYQAANGWSSFTNIFGMCSGTITVEATPAEGGTVTGGGTFEGGQICMVTATPNQGYAFGNWTQNGNVVSTEPEYAFYVTMDETLVAHFVPEGNIVFADSNVKSICISYWDADGDGELSYSEAATVTDLSHSFQSNTEIVMFNELQYFIGLSSIGESTFRRCSGLTSIIIPKSVIEIVDNPFKECPGLEQIVVDSSNPMYDSRGNCNAIIETNSNILVSGCKNTIIPNSVIAVGDFAFYNSFTGHISFPNSVITIGNGAFMDCPGLSGSLILPNSLTTIGAYAFDDCTGLTGSLTIPNSVTTIGSCAFNNCTGFTGSLTIPNSVTTIGNTAFQQCRFTGSLIIPSSITTIEEFTFNMCWNFTSVEIPESVTFIGERAFACWYGLQSMTVLATTPPTLENYAFVNVNKSKPVYVPAGTVAAYQAASGWNEFTNYLEIESTSYTVTVSANPAEGGSITGGGLYTQGTTCTLTATPNESYSFVNWTENNEVVSTNANYSFTVSGNRNLVANFALSGTITNHWTPESANYSEIMAMYTVIQIDGVEQYSNMLEVGVFCGEECRGSAIASEFYLTHRYLAILDVFGENGHQLTFKLYNHSIGQELNLTSPATVTFDVNGYGNPVEPYALNFTSSITHSQALNSGWNWWSTYIEQNGIDGLGMLENSIGSAGVRIQGRNGTIDQFEYQGSNYWYGSLTSIENEQMYKIRTNAACNAVMVGNMTLPANHPITINGGWNWIGFPCNQSVSVNDAMSSFTPVANDVIKGRNGSTTYVSYGSTSLWYGTLNTLEPGQGYMYKSNSNTSKTLVFQMGRGEETVTNVTEENSFFTPNTDDFSDNMLVTAVIDMDGQELRSEDYEVAAYVGNECRGSVRLMYVEPFDRYVAFLLVFGETEEEIHFVLTDGNDVVLSNDFLTYTADDLEGTVTEPAILHFGTLGLNNNEHDFVNIFPNPSNGIFNIEGNGLRKIEVVNAFGQTVLLREVENNLMQIDLGDKAAGVYLLRVITNNGITTKQIVKE